MNCMINIILVSVVSLALHQYLTQMIPVLADGLISKKLNAAYMLQTNHNKVIKIFDFKT